MKFTKLAAFAAAGVAGHLVWRTAAEVRSLRTEAAKRNQSWLGDRFAEQFQADQQPKRADHE